MARALGVSGGFGKQLDSLADMVTFGVLPSIMLYQHITVGYGEYFIPIDQRPLNHIIVEFSGFIYAIFSALRLAQFNISENQSDTFIGLPTPAAAILVVSFGLILSSRYNLNMYFPLENTGLDELMKSQYWSAGDVFLIQSLYQPNIYVIVNIFLCIMMVAPIPMLNLKFKSMSWHPNKDRYVFLMVILFLLIYTLLAYYSNVAGFIYLGITIVPIIIIVYILTSLIVYLKP